MDATMEVKTVVEAVNGMPLNVTCRFYSVGDVGKWLAENPGHAVVYYNAKTKTLYVPVG
jgi:hypothetical protein